jgi:hypothetical protein
MLTPPTNLSLARKFKFVGLRDKRIGPPAILPVMDAKGDCRIHGAVGEDNIPRITSLLDLL